MHHNVLSVLCIYALIAAAGGASAREFPEEVAESYALSISSIATGNDVLCAFGDRHFILVIKSDFSSVHLVPAPKEGRIRFGEFVQNAFVGLSDRGRIFQSRDGVQWSSELARLPNDKYVGLAKAGDFLAAVSRRGGLVDVRSTSHSIVGSIALDDGDYVKFVDSNGAFAVAGSHRGKVIQIDGSGNCRVISESEQEWKLYGVAAFGDGNVATLVGRKERGGEWVQVYRRYAGDRYVELASVRSTRKEIRRDVFVIGDVIVSSSESGVHSAHIGDMQWRKLSIGFGKTTVGDVVHFSGTYVLLGRDGLTVYSRNLQSWYGASHLVREAD